MAKFKTMDGNEAAAYASYPFTEVAGIYPITPSSPMADFTDAWAAQGKKTSLAQRLGWLRCKVKAARLVRFMARFKLAR